MNEQRNRSAKIVPEGSKLVSARPHQTEFTESDNSISLRELIGAVWKRLSLIVLVAVVLVGAVVGFSLLQTPTYEASIKLIVGQGGGIAETPGDVDGLQLLTQTMAEGVNDRPVTEEVIRRLDLRIPPEALEERLNVRQLGESLFIQVDYGDSEPESAKRIVNTVGEVFSEKISGTNPGDNGITVRVWEPATFPQEPSSPTPIRNGLVALMVGLILGTCLALILEYLEDNWRSPEEAERLSGFPTIGVIPAYRNRGTEEAVEDQ